MKLGIVGLPNVGKSTLFNAITNAGAESANYPFCTIEPNIGTVPVPDERLDVLQKLYDSKKIVPAVISFVDIAGLVRGASKGEGLGNKFLSHIREVDSVIHVVRCFDDVNIVHVEGGSDPARDIEIIDLELILSDMEMVDRRIDKAEKLAKGDKKYLAEAELFKRLKEHMNSGGRARSFECSSEEGDLISSCGLLSAKPVIYAANMSEEDINSYEDNSYYKAVKSIADKEGSLVIPVCARIEEEIALLDSEERALFLQELGLPQSGLDRLIKASYELLGLISFLTAGEPEVRAWTIEKGTKAPQAAGKIHSDIERGFIRAEIVSYDDLCLCGSLAAARDKGLIRSEGKEYVMKESDVVLFRFNV